MDATPDEEEDKSILTKKINDLNNLIDEEGLEEETEKENVSKDESPAAGVDPDDDGDSLVICEEEPEKLNCKQCNFVTSAKSKKDRTSGLKRHVKSHHFENFVTEAATEQTTSDDTRHVQDNDEEDVAADDDIEMNSTSPEIEKAGPCCTLCGFASSASRKTDFVSSMKRHMRRKHGGEAKRFVADEDNSKIKVEQTAKMMETSIEDEDVSMEEDQTEEPEIAQEVEDLVTSPNEDLVTSSNVDLVTSSNEDLVGSSVENMENSSNVVSIASLACAICGFASKSVSKANQVFFLHLIMKS